MGSRVACIVVLTCALLTAACAWPGAAYCASRITYAAAPVIDEAPVFQAIRDSVIQLQNALHHKVASVLTSKVAEKIEGASYESTWQVAVKYWLDYSRPENVPYLKGMEKCLIEYSPTAGKEWVAWAKTQIDQRRSQYTDEIAFQQELQLRATVTASLDAGGKLLAQTMKVFHVVSESEMVTFSAESLAAPSDRQMEQAGYYFLKDKIAEESSATSGGSATTSTQETPSNSSGGQPSKAVVAIPSQNAGTGAERARPILMTGVGGLFVLLLLLVLNQHLLRKRKR